MITYSNLGKNGRLGNQLFQISSTIGVALKNGHEFCFPKWDYAQYFDHPLPEGYPSGTVVYKEPNYRYHDIVLSTTKNWDLDGYFQSWKYFNDYKDTVQHYLAFYRKPVHKVAVHVRRGDYLQLQHIHPVLPIDYYRRAMEYFKGEMFTIFSDDIFWCIENLNGYNVEFYHPDTDINTFQAMAQYDYFVIANSSFSYWAAYLANSTQVIAPKNYVIGEEVDDRLLPEWIKL